MNSACINLIVEKILKSTPSLAQLVPKPPISRLAFLARTFKIVLSSYFSMFSTPKLQLFRAFCLYRGFISTTSRTFKRNGVFVLRFKREAIRLRCI